MIRLQLAGGCVTHPVCPAVIASIWLISVVGCKQQNAGNEKKAPLPIPTIEAKVVTVAAQSWPKIIRAQGSVFADDVAVIGNRVEGRVDTVHVDLGDFVTANTPLVTLRQEQFRLMVEKARAHLLQARSAIGLSPDGSLDKLDPENSPPVREQKAEWDHAETDLARAEELRERDAISVANFKQFQTAVQVAKARYDSSRNAVREKIALVKVRAAELGLMEENLKESVIVAPYDGYIQEKHVSSGTYVRVGDSLVTVVRTDPLRFRGTVPEKHALAVKEGQSVQLMIQSVHSPFNAKITRISPSLDPLSRSLLFEADVPNNDGRLRTGLFTEANIVIDETSTAIVIPHSALVEFAGTQKVWKVVDGKSSEQVVLTGERRNAGIEVLNGLKAGVVILMDGAKGRVAKVKAVDEDSAVMRNEK